MSDSQYNGQTRVQVLLEYLQEREMDLEDLGQVRRIKLEQCIQLCQFETDANQVITEFKSRRPSYKAFHGFGWAEFLDAGSVLGSSQFVQPPQLPIKKNYHLNSLI